MIEILIADDHPIVRQGLRSAFSDTCDIHVRGEAADGSQALAIARQEAFDVILLDLAMPLMNGLDVLKEIMLEKPKSHVLILSAYSDKHYAVRCFRAGAMGYITKECATTEFVQAIRRVNLGRKYVSASLAQQLVDETDLDSQRPLHETLSDREFQVLCLLGQGKSVTESAKILNLGIPTVSTYRARILDKMKLRSTAQLIVYALEHKLISNVYADSPLPSSPR